MQLDKIRQDIDAVDNSLAELFVRRMALAKQVGEEKAAQGLPVVNSAREKQILSRVGDLFPEELKLYGKQFFETLFETSKAYQYAALKLGSPIAERLSEAIENMRPFPVQASVACQGVQGAYSCIAAERFFPIPSVSCFKTWEGVFGAVEKGLCRYGVLPIENSSAGSVMGVYDLMRKHRFYIVRSLRLQVRHCLLAPKGVRIEDVREVASHDQALLQCDRALKELDGVKLTRMDNTAVAAKYVAECGRRDVACVASKECADIYGLDVLKKDIADSAGNFTRFIVISNKLETFEGANRISIQVNLAHEAGSLNRLLNKFSAAGLNLTKLESRPIPDRPFEFCFYFDFEARATSQSVQNLLGAISAEVEDFEFLGAYEELV